MYTCIQTYLFDLEARRRPICYTLAACNMIAAVISMLCKIWDTSQASSDDLETSEQIQFGDECKLRSPETLLVTRETQSTTAKQCEAP